MKLVYFLVGAIVGALIWGYLDNRADRDHILFPTAQFYDGGDWISAKGSVYSDRDEDPPVNNYLEVECYQDRMECDVISIDEVAENQTGLFNEAILDAVRWDEDTVIVSSESRKGQACTFYELRINRATKHIDYLRYKNHDATDAMCSVYDDRKWWIDNGMSWSMDADGTSR